MSMDFFNQFLDNIKQIVIEAIREALQQIKQEACEEWVTTKEIAEHLKQSESWVSGYLHTIPHVKHEKAVKFRKSDVDKWRIENFGRHYDLADEKCTVSKATGNTNKSAWKPID